ncbi:MAG: pseudouridine synthase [Candidatus Saccharimonas sp.]|nr:MAG: pseudouridine synthase [Candidatus Saccharimonas sp.]
MEQKTERLNKFLALQLGISRRQADELIEKGRISINGKTAQLGERFKAGDEIKLGEKIISKTREEKKYVIFNKPRGYVCSRKKQGENETIYAILPKEFSVLKPVGRLDKDSSGILLLTNDGDFAFQMTHPKFRKVKEYLVSLDTPLQPIHQQMIADFGINLPDGKSQLGLERLDDSRKNWKVIMSEGRNRQIRRTFSAIGYEVEELHRTVFGSYILPKDLNFGDFRKVEKL